jgi:rRNA-processing protein FCF1
MERIIVDTSAILFGLSSNADIFAKIRELGMVPVISEGVIKELYGLSGSGGSKGRDAAVALQLIGKHRVETDKDAGYVDDWIAAAAEKFGSVCTNDAELRARIRGKKAKVYTVTVGGELRQ